MLSNWIINNHHLKNGSDWGYFFQISFGTRYTAIEQQLRSKKSGLVKSEFNFQISKDVFKVSQNYMKSICSKYVVPEIRLSKFLITREFMWKNNVTLQLKKKVHVQ